MAEEVKAKAPWYKRWISLPFLIGAAIVVYILFFSNYSIQRLSSYNARIAELEAEIKASTDTFDYYYNLNQQLKTDPERIEEVVREKYHFQRANEDVYVFE